MVQDLQEFLSPNACSKVEEVCALLGQDDPLCAATKRGCESRLPESNERANTAIQGEMNTATATDEGKILGSGDQEALVVSNFDDFMQITQDDLDTWHNNGLYFTQEVIKKAHDYLDGARTLTYIKGRITGGQPGQAVIQDFSLIPESIAIWFPGNYFSWGTPRQPSGTTLLQRGGWNAVGRDGWVEIQVFHTYAFTDTGANNKWWSRKFTVRCFKVTCPSNIGIGSDGTCNNCFKLATGCSALTYQTWSELSNCDNDGFAVL